jgi:hypothetical protein
MEGVIKVLTTHLSQRIKERYHHGSGLRSAKPSGLWPCHEGRYGRHSRAAKHVQGEWQIAVYPVYSDSKITMKRVYAKML